MQTRWRYWGPTRYAPCDCGALDAVRTLRHKKTAQGAFHDMFRFQSMIVNRGSLEGSWPTGIVRVVSCPNLSLPIQMTCRKAYRVLHPHVCSIHHDMTCTVWCLLRPSPLHLCHNKRISWKQDGYKVQWNFKRHDVTCVSSPVRITAS